MTVSIIRPCTVEDYSRVEAAARRFCTTYNITGPGTDIEAIEYWMEYGEDYTRGQRRNKWAKVFCRALRVPQNVRTVIYGGYVGRWIE